MAMNGKNRIMIYGPKADSTYIVEFRAAADEARDPMPGSEAAVIRYFQSVCSNGLFMPIRNACRVGTAPARLLVGGRGVQAPKNGQRSSRKPSEVG
jgi:hypothetical protein